MHRLTLLLCVLYPVVVCDFDISNMRMDKDSYGPYNIVHKKFEACEAVSRDRTSDYTVTLIKEKDYFLGFVNMTINKPCIFSSSKITMYFTKELVKKQLFNYNIREPCKHFALGPIIVNHFRIKKNCRIDKGNYQIQLNLTESSKAFFGASFFYGDFQFKASMRCKTDSLCCIAVVAAVEKKY